jgi:hypothetical protein
LKLFCKQDALPMLAVTLLLLAASLLLGLFKEKGWL